ncbi:MAG: translation initiation factor eIF-2B [Anaerolineales bacterium]
MTSTQWQSDMEQLRRDNRSGAEEIARRALNLLMEAITEVVPEGREDYEAWLVQIARDVIAAQPSMGVLFRLVNDMLWAQEEETENEAIRQSALRFLQQYHECEARAMQGVLEHATPHLENYSAVMTYSRSSTVLRVLTDMREGGWRARVFCSEGRPMLEGQTLANELADAGLRVILGVDMALFEWLEEIEALVLGGDTLAAGGLVNKVGTAELVRAARRRDIPRIVLCTTRKLLPSDYLTSLRFREGPPEEIMPTSDESISIRNQYFDLTPLGQISMVITEEGPMERSELTEAFERISTYPGLRGRPEVR